MWVAMLMGDCYRQATRMPVKLIVFPPDSWPCRIGNEGAGILDLNRPDNTKISQRSPTAAGLLGLRAETPTSRTRESPALKLRPCVGRGSGVASGDLDATHHHFVKGASFSFHDEGWLSAARRRNYRSGTSPISSR